jgi:uncharacterized protein YbaR (Trm112 family)
MGAVGESVIVQCPWCGEPIEVWVEPDGEGTTVQDCDVCCRPCELVIRIDDGVPSVQVTRS